MARPRVPKIDIRDTSIPNDINIWMYGGNAKTQTQLPMTTCIKLAKELLFDLFTQEFKRFNRLRKPSLEEFPLMILETRYTIVLFSFLWAHAVARKEFDAAGHYMAYLEKASKAWLSRTKVKKFKMDTI